MPKEVMRRASNPNPSPNPSPNPDPKPSPNPSPNPNPNPNPNPDPDPNPKQVMRRAFEELGALYVILVRVRVRVS